MKKKSLEMKTLYLFKKNSSPNNKILWLSMKSLKFKVTKTAMKSSYLTMMPMTMSLK